MRNNYLNKARTLEMLNSNIETAKILPLYIASRVAFEKDKDTVINEIKSFFNEDLLIIRSSSTDEDTEASSNAGKYKTIANVNKKDRLSLIKSIEMVFSSYPTSNPADEVLIQPMLTSMPYSGVAFTCDMDTLSPYYCINYALNSKGDEVTSGASSELITYIHYKQSESTPCDPILANIITTCKELEDLMDTPYLDIEFGVDNSF